MQHLQCCAQSLLEEKKKKKFKTFNRLASDATNSDTDNVDAVCEPGASFDD